MTINRFLFFSLSLLSLCISCRNGGPSTAVNSLDTNVSSSKATNKPAAYVAVKTWIDDFRNFRMAIYNQDAVQLRTYFNFPVEDNERNLWIIIYGYKGEPEAHKAAYTEPVFTEKDFNTHYKKMFPGSFVTGLLKIKSEVLYSKGAAATKRFMSKPKELEADSRLYNVSANVSEDGQQLFLNVNYYNGEDETGAYVSEGEFSYMFTFDIIDHKKLIFKTVRSAG